MVEKETEIVAKVIRPTLVPDCKETILLVENDDAVRKYATEVLSARGYYVIHAPDGNQALANFAGLEKGIDLLITDVAMPGIGARELANRLQCQHPQTRVLYVSGYTDDPILRHGILDRGLAFLGKPFSAEALALKVWEVLTTPNTKPLVLLMVDDQTICTLLKDNLEQAGYEVLAASDGKQAIQICRKILVGLVITDFARPEQGGLETIETLRWDFPNTPIVAASAAFETGVFREVSERLGAAAAFQKPLDLSRLLDTVRSLLPAGVCITEIDSANSSRATMGAAGPAETHAYVGNTADAQ